jgi:antitoxin component YwqK of YwqJK toxin-antitoxin module
VKWISYTSENLIHTKRNYFYDDQQRLIKQIDSAGWYFTTIKPYWESTTTIQYSDTGRIVTKINNTKERFVSSTPKIVSHFNTRDKLIKQCTLSDTSESCTQYIYTYDKNKITKEEIIFDNGTISSTEFYYNNSGLLREERTLRNGNLTTLIRYYYE